MCAVSMIMDHYRHTLPASHQWATNPTPITTPTRIEFDALRKEVENLKELLAKAKEYDARTGQPDCEDEEKLTLLRAIAAKVGVEL